MTEAAPKRVVLLPGDGIGPEVTAAAVGVMERALRDSGIQVRWQEAAIGGIAIDRHGDPLPDATLAMVDAADAVLLGAVGGPRWDARPVRPEAGLLRLRKHMEVYANLRPFQIYPPLRDLSPLALRWLPIGGEVRGLIIRELTGGLYFGQPRGRTALADGDEEAVDTLRYRKREIERLVRIGFGLAEKAQVPLVSIDKANVLVSSRLWRETVDEVGQEFPAVPVIHRLVDAAAMELVTRPDRYRVAVTENLFGDILSDLAGGLVGSLGLLPSASLKGLGAEPAPGLYEPVHGSAPDIAGSDRANPTGAILSGAMLLRHSLGLEKAAAAIEQAVARAFQEGLRTADLGDGHVVGCREFGRRVEALID